jgi:hypothetical protein
MPKILRTYLNDEPGRSILCLGLLISIKLVTQIILATQGFISVSADEFSRGLRAAKWALQPSLSIADVSDLWLPFEKYLNGTVLMLWPDAIWAPRVTVFVASCIVLLALFALTRYLFKSFLAAALAAVFVTFLPWYTWLSGTPMLEMYYLAPFISGLLFLIIWLREGRRGYWMWAGLCFALATGFHVQSWIFINLVNLLTLPYLVRDVRQKRFGRIGRLIGFYVLSNSLIATFALLEFLDTGQVFVFLAHHTSYSKWFHGGYNVPVLEKLLYYPRQVVWHSSSAVWILLIVALVFVMYDKSMRWTVFPLATAAVALSVTSGMNVLSGPPSAAPGRYSVFYLIMVAPYIGYGVRSAITLTKRHPSRLVAYLPTVIAGGLFLYSVGWGIARIPSFPRGMSIDAIEVGYYLNQALSEDETDRAAAYMVELHYWDHLGVQLAAQHYGRYLYDRAYDLRDRNTPSIFLGAPEGICTGLISDNVRYVALHDSGLRAATDSIGCLESATEIGHWGVYRVNPAH